MKCKTIILTLTLSAPLLFSGELYSQERTEMSKTEHARIDSLQVMYKSDQVQIEKANDEDRMTAVKTKRKQAKAKAKEAKRIEREASDASRESLNALRAEKKAQKARKDADAQAKKASRARFKSDKN